MEGVYGVTVEAGARNVEDFKNFKTAYNLVISLGRLDDEMKSVLTDALKVFYKAMRSVSKAEREMRRLAKEEKTEALPMLEDGDSEGENDTES